MFNIFNLFKIAKKKKAKKEVKPETKPLESIKKDSGTRIISRSNG